MKNPFSLFNRRNLETSFGILQSRFPIATMIIIFLTSLLLYMVHAEPEINNYLRVVFSLIVTFFLSVSIALIREQNNKYTKIALILPILYGILFYTTLTPFINDWMFDSITYFILHLVGFAMFIFFAPYYRVIFSLDKKSIEYSNYFARVAWTFLMSIIVGGSLVMLGFIAIGSVVTLFDLSGIQIIQKIYGDWATISLSLIAPLYCLIHLPIRDDVEKRTYEVNRFFSFLIRYIATPFIVIYFIILYAYSAKVLLHFHDWPKGMISWMVIGFSSFGYLTYVFSRSYEDESSIIKIFRRYFPYAVPAQILMLGYAIYLRIAQYDLTMNRYFVVIFGVWLTIISLYYIASQKKGLAVIPATLSLISLVISVGPWSVYHLPLIRQYNHLIHNLSVAGMYSDGVVAQKKGTIDPVLENNIYSEIEYTCRYSRCEKIKTLFAKELAGKETEYQKKWSENEYNKDKKYPGMSSWEIISEVTTAIGISNGYTILPSSATKYISFSTKNTYPESAYPINVSGYETLVRVFTSDYSAPEGTTYVTINADKSELTLHNYHGTNKTFSLQTFNKKLSEKYKNTDNTNVDTGDLTTIFTIDTLDIKLLLESYSIVNPQYVGDNLNMYSNISGYALIRKK